MIPCYSLWNMKVIWLYMVSATPLITITAGGRERWQNVFLHLWQDKPLWAELKTNEGVISTTVLLHFHYFTQKSELFLLIISLRNVNTSVVSCRYPQVYIFSFRQKIFRKSFRGSLTASSTTPFVKNSPDRCVSSLQYIKEYYIIYAS